MKRAKLEEMTVDKLVEGFLRRSPLTHHDSLRHRCALSRPAAGLPASGKF